MDLHSGIHVVLTILGDCLDHAEVHIWSELVEKNSFGLDHSRVVHGERQELKGMMKAHPKFSLLRHLEFELVLDDLYEVLAQHDHLHFPQHLPALHHPPPMQLLRELCRVDKDGQLLHLLVLHLAVSLLAVLQHFNL